VNILHQQATELRDNGYSYNMIKKKLGVSISTQSNWFANRPFTPNPELLERVKSGSMKNGQLRHNEKVANIDKALRSAAKEIGKLSKRDLWMIGLGLYMGEGSKSIESVRIVNSDPDIIRFAMRWFREICKLENDNFALSLNLYPDSNEDEAIKYWSKITNLTRANFKKTHVDERSNKMRIHANKLPYGTLQVRINANGDKSKGVALFRKIKGWSIAAHNQI
jgi:hypothetical protein